MNEAIEVISGKIIVVDDIIIFGKGETNYEAIQDHDENLLKLLKILQEKNIKLNSDKIKFK